MKLLLDTHTLLWFLQDHQDLSPTAKALIEEPNHQKHVSAASCWEIAIKSTRGKLGLSEPSGVLLARELPRNGFDVLNINLEHATHVELLPEHHKIPFDRLLVAQSMIEGMPLVSVDTQMDAYGITRFW